MTYLEDFRKTILSQFAAAYEPFFTQAQALHRAFEQNIPAVELEQILAQYRIAFVDGETERTIHCIFGDTPREQINVRHLHDVFVPGVLARYFGTFEQILTVYREDIPMNHRHAYERFQLEERQLLERLASFS
jgi:tRNA A58 N-methylase Trm61